MWLKKLAIGHRGRREFALYAAGAETRNDKLGAPDRGEWSVGEFFLDLADSGEPDEYVKAATPSPPAICAHDNAELSGVAVYDELNLISPGSSVAEWYSEWWTKYQHLPDASAVQDVADYFEVTGDPDACPRP